MNELQKEKTPAALPLTQALHDVVPIPASTGNTGTEDSQTAAEKQELDDDLSEIQTLEEFLDEHEKDEPPADFDPQKFKSGTDGEDDFEDGDDPKAWRIYVNNVERNWVADRKKVEFADKVIELQNKVKSNKELWSSILAETTGDDLPPIQSAADADIEDLPEPAQVIHGLLYAGCKIILGSTSKGKKTWALMDLAFAVSTGGKWMNYLQCSKGKILYLNLELIPYTFQKRRKAIMGARGIGLRHLGDNLHFINLKGRAVDIKEMAPKIVKAAKDNGYSLIILDPIYKVYGGRSENDAGAMGELVNHLETVCTETGAALAFAAHFPKGDLSARVAMDRISGSGVFARDPEVVMTMTQIKPDEPSDREMDRMSPTELVETLSSMTSADLASGNYLTVETVLRDFPPVDPFTIKWEYPVFNQNMELDPAEIKRQKDEAKRASKQMDVNRMLKWLRDHFEKNPTQASEGIKADDWRNGSKAKKDSFFGYTRTLQMAGFIVRDNAKAPWKLTGKPGFVDLNQVIEVERKAEEERQNSAENLF